MSELAKLQCWELFSNGEFRIICATDAAGMGCNVSDVKYIVTFGLTKSLGTISQRWGRAGRNRTIEGVCLWLVEYVQGATGLIVVWANRKYHGHRTLPLKILSKLKNEFDAKYGHD